MRLNDGDSAALFGRYSSGRFLNLTLEGAPLVGLPKTDTLITFVRVKLYYSYGYNIYL